MVSLTWLHSSTSPTIQVEPGYSWYSRWLATGLGEDGVKENKCRWDTGMSLWLGGRVVLCVGAHCLLHDHSNEKIRYAHVDDEDEDHEFLAVEPIDQGG